LHVIAAVVLRGPVVSQRVVCGVQLRFQRQSRSAVDGVNTPRPTARAYADRGAPCAPRMFDHVARGRVTACHPGERRGWSLPSYALLRHAVHRRISPSLPGDRRRFVPSPSVVEQPTVVPARPRPSRGQSVPRLPFFFCQRKNGPRSRTYAAPRSRSPTSVADDGTVPGRQPVRARGGCRYGFVFRRSDRPAAPDFVFTSPVLVGDRALVVRTHPTKDALT